MTYERLAQVFEQARAGGASTAEALRKVDEARGRRRARKLTPVAIEQMRARRAKGEKLETIATAFGISIPYAGTLCAGIRPEPAIGPDEPSLAASVVRAAEEGLELARVREAESRAPGRHRSAFSVRARWVAMVILRRRIGWSLPRIARALGLDDHTTVIYGLKRAAANKDLIRVAFAVADRLSLALDGQQQEAA